MDKNDIITTDKERTMAGSIPVYCRYDEIASADKIRPNPNNPNNHPQEQIELLSNIISKQGWRAPITISKRSGYITKGHGRLMAMQHLGEAHAPVEYQYYESEEAEYADMIADNRIAELAEMDEDILHDILSDMAETDIDLTLTGYDDEELDRLLAELQDEIDDDEEDDEEKKDLPRVPLSRGGDVWLLGPHIINVGDTTGDELLVVDVMVGSYIEHTGNISAMCVRDGMRIPYMTLIREWAEANDCLHILMEQKVPILKFKK